MCALTRFHSLTHPTHPSLPLPSSPFPFPPLPCYSVDTHFSGKPVTVTFAPNDVEKCIGIDILMEEGNAKDLVFLVTLVPLRPEGVMNASILVGDDTTVVITEASE